MMRNRKRAGREMMVATAATGVFTVVFLANLFGTRRADDSIFPSSSVGSRRSVREIGGFDTVGSIGSTVERHQDMREKE